MLLTDQRLPILPGRLQPSTFGVHVLNCRVRYGYGWVHMAIITGFYFFAPSKLHRRTLQTFPSRQALGLLVPVRSTPYRASTPGLSSRRLRVTLLAFAMRGFISGPASRLDAFSAYPFRTQLPSRTAGAMTGSPSVRPLRSSRTRSSSLHASSARDGYGPNCLTTF